MRLTWYGTATIGLDDGETKLLFDPFVRMNRRIETTPLEGFVGFDAVLVTHGHLDHIYSIPALMRTDANVPVYCTETPKKTLVSRGAPAERIRLIRRNEIMRFFHPQEAALIRQSEQLDLELLRIWTRKESYGKRIGSGIGYAMKQFCFSDPQMDASVLFQECLAEDYLITVCTERETHVQFVKTECSEEWCAAAAE